MAESDNQIQPIILEEGVKSMSIILRAGLVNGKTIDIVGYDITLGRFDCSDEKTRTFEDFEYFIVPKDEFKAISDKILISSSKPVSTKKISTTKNDDAQTE